ncbi:GntR family transcriptional regulator [Actinorhabdospora filicis]|uniref:GntR family transcriptional regulator n=1 Tax=Actinorhabdospora filicis TaxID=1785913 RepID=A0A9W6SPR3_9ACTN|nr:GntR family transcriptional regulator [Actinorhabdospora filicis]GLZ79873.1 GntR family transcriptional regulator [Actinorhabdospora filicis]
MSGTPRRDHAHATLKRRIVEAAYLPGHRLVERDLAEELDLSRIPLREALRQLAAEGLVVTVPGKGTIVAPVTPDDVRDLFDVREALEGLAARLAAERATDEGRARLRECVERARDVRGAEQINARADFHDELVALSGNALLADVLGGISARVRRLFHLTGDRDAEVQCAEHEALYEAIAVGDGVRAAELGVRHVTGGRAETIAAAEAWTGVDPEEATRTRRRRRAG